jgi:hypothetical protein
MIPSRCLLTSCLLQLWATVGFAFNVSVACTSVSSRIKKSYDILIEALDQVGCRDTQRLALARCMWFLLCVVMWEVRKGLRAS